MIDTTKIEQHYGQASLIERLQSALKADGLDGNAIRPEDLASLDQFHSRGLEATIELARALQMGSQTRVLDIGSGLGGPSRYLAATYGCTVSGIDLNPSYVDAAKFLADRTGLSDRVSYSCASALSLPFESGIFDIAWTQHVAMNVADRATLYSEAFRVLRPGGRFAIYDVVATSDEPLHYPVPWAASPETSFLVTADQMRSRLLDQTFRVTAWKDCTEAGIRWFAEREKARASQQANPALGLHVVMGPGFAGMTKNLARNLREGRAALMQVIVEKP
ncbi:class I SAM-dependent methyltransferase [Paraburkholderia humisilvae]|uniref:2-methoxy-6-polyprenyl-1,4-benzoquinol methylase, mitochondrial n=1 Tax=Paraburkholderia humisilvae TaxID=627669 RepID=A0A6J5CW18_9BURK|nr:methyltransferase domain-containing protein [Paraburkholderia humisilvae]CAB3745753.1 2-methoxy-6-polyprenyl-1,4-benzoquinol methylase, mitochondrial [Paraburkholderia humisilvae]